MGFRVEKFQPEESKPVEKSNGVRGRHAKYPLLQLKLNESIVIPNVEIGGISPLLTYANQKRTTGTLHARTENKGVRVYVTRAKNKELATTN